MTATLVALHDSLRSKLFSKNIQEKKVQVLALGKDAFKLVLTEKSEEGEAKQKEFLTALH